MWKADLRLTKRKRLLFLGNNRSFASALHSLMLTNKAVVFPTFLLLEEEYP